jgi:solute carrier family 25 oxoglutarate transporter 11
MSKDNSAAQQSWIGTLKYFGIAALSGICSTSCMHPVDTLKVRMQILNEELGQRGQRVLLNPIKVANGMWRSDGVRAFYKGFDSSLMKQCTYQTARLGVYKFLYEKEVRNVGQVPFLKKLQFALTAAVASALVGNPADITMIRRQSDLSLPPADRRNYKNVFEAMYRIVRTEGFFTLWTGLPYALVRVMAICCSQLTTFDEVKERTRKWRGGKEDDIYSRVAAAAVSGLACTITALPFDNMKVKYQKMKQNPDGTWPYRSLLDAFAKTFRREGLLGFWAGLPAFYFYVAPHTLISLLSQDYFHILFNKSVRH